MSRQATQPIEPAPPSTDAAATSVSGRNSVTLVGAASAANQGPEAGVARSAHLDATLDKAHALAVSQHHAGVSSEHLLFALTEDPDALGVMGASTVNIERLRADIGTHLSQFPASAQAGQPVLPNADLLKVLKLAAMAAQQSARRQIDGAIVMAAIIGDASTPSAGMLRAHGLTFNEVIRVLQKGAAQTTATTTAPAALHATAPPVATDQPPGPDPVPATPSAVATTKGQPAVPGGEPSDPPTARLNGPPPPLEPSGVSTDELLASVRQRLQKSAPPLRQIERPPPAKAAPPLTRDLAPLDAPQPRPPSSSDDASAVVPIAVATPSDLIDPPPPMPATDDPPTQPVRAIAPTTAAPMQMPRTPDDLRPPVADDWADDERPLSQPPLPLVPAGGPRTAPPPLPLPTLAAAPPPPPAATGASYQNPATAATYLGPAPMAPTPMQQAPHHHQQLRVPPIPPPIIDMRALMAAIPKQMRQGETTVVEITLPRRSLEIPMAAGHRWPPLRVTTMRLRAPPDLAHVELASPETLWISPPRVHQGAADDATWRWRVTPRVEGPVKLQLAGATRIVGGEGISGEVPFGEEQIEVDVMRRGSRRSLFGLVLFANLIAIGALAMVMSGRAGELASDTWTMLRGLVGGG